MRYDSSRYTDLTDEELIQRVRDGDEAAFAQLASRHSSRIWQMVVSHSRQIRDAEEIFQDVWVAVWQNIGGLREVSSFGAWLRKIAYTTCRRYYAAKSHNSGEILQSAEKLAETIDRDVLAHTREIELRTAVTEAVYHLPERVRAVAVLYYLELWTVNEIAEELGLAAGTVKTRLRQIRALLREEFGVEEIERGATMIGQKEVSKPVRDKLKIFGVGDAGGNVIKQMIASNWTKEVEFYAVNTDLEALRTCEGATQIQIGIDTTQGFSADANPEIGRSAAEENLETLDAALTDARLVFVVAGMGGGTGTGAAPLIASVAHEHEALTIGVVTLPFDFEGQPRTEQAEYGCQELQEHTDAVIVVPNQRLLETVDVEPSPSEAYRMSDETVLRGVKSVADIIVESGEINVDFADVASVMQNAGRVLMGIGKANGENRARIAMENAVSSPLLDGGKLGNAPGVIVNISAPQDFMMNELDAGMTVIKDVAPDAMIIFGLVYRDDTPESEDSVDVAVLATGISGQSEPTTPFSTRQDGTSPDSRGSIPSKTASEFVHLHNHSEYSMLDGACRISDMVDWAVTHSVPAVALTDHGNMFGAWELYNKASDAGIKPIIGCEVYVAPGNRKNRAQDMDDPYHLTLIAEDATGYQNLLELVSLGYTEGFHRKPRIDMEILREHREGIIALTGCIQGQVPQLLCTNRRDEAIQNFKTLMEIMGQHNLYVEVQNHYIDKELEAYPVMVQLAQEFNLPLVGTNDCHYLRKSDHRMHDVLLCMQAKKTVNDQDRVRFDNHFYFKSVDEMREALKDYPPEAISNTLEITNRCNLELDYQRDPMPKYKVPKDYTHDSYLRELCYRGLREKYGELSEPIRQRMDYELDIIKQTGHANYFLIVGDYVNHAHKQGYPLSARGSAASSLVLYALDVISFNPMDHGCLFERFLNLERLAPPDIDIDFADRARESIIEYLAKKYGADSVGKIATFATLGAKSAIMNVGRALNMPREKIAKLTELIPLIPRITLDEALEQVPEFQALAELPENRELIQMSRAVEGMKQHVSCHASGIAISDGPLTNYVPLFKDRHDQIATQFDGKIVEDIGIVKFDSLGVRSLSELHDCLQMIKANHGTDIKLEEIPFDDKETYSLIGNGLVAGLFQLETSPGMFRVVTELRPDNFEELSAIPALYRPGPIESGAMQDYIDRKNGVQAIVYGHHSFEGALRSTYGVCIYQEQVMQIAHDVAGFTFAEADVLRSVIGKRNEVLIEEQRGKFVEGAMKKGVAKAEAETIFGLLEPTARYAFNKSHTVAYSMLAYRMAYLKTHYPREFMAAMMTGESGSAEKIARYRSECKKLADFLGVEIELLPLDINRSEKGYMVEGNGIRDGFVGVKGVGNEVIDSILAARESGGVFTSLQDFRARVDGVNERIIASLVDSGAFDAV
ncbi:DNA polymerase III subunit alpha [Candidatus Poribacteria bacterium]|nr:DNA polymerase III subunit alpha [Candidatus Poribacteria bacterium]